MTIRLWFLASITLMAVPAIAGIFDITPTDWSETEGAISVVESFADR